MGPGHYIQDVENVVNYYISVKQNRIREVFFIDSRVLRLIKTLLIIYYCQNGQFFIHNCIWNLALKYIATSYFRYQNGEKSKLEGVCFSSYVL